MTIDGLDLEAERHWTLLDAARHLGIEIPTLCAMEGLTPWGGCRLCIVEVGTAPRSRLVSSCTYPVEDGLNVLTNSSWVIRTRRMLVELMLGACSGSKELQDLAARYRVEKMRYRAKHDDCILCGRCVRMCAEQMMGAAIGFIGRGQDLRIHTPFMKPSEACRRCGGCMYVCPVCSGRCQGPDATNDVCGRCGSMTPTCSAVFDQYMCYMGSTGSCGTCVREEPGPGSCAPHTVTPGGE